MTHQEGGIKMFKFKTCFEDFHGKKMGIARIVPMVVAGLAIAAVFALLFGLLVKALWNWLMPGIFNLPEITYWQAFGLVILAKIFFGSFSAHDDEHKSSKTKHKEPDHKDFEEYWEEEGKNAFYKWMIIKKEKPAAEKKRRSPSPKKVKSD
jgi:hypothetical protein